MPTTSCTSQGSIITVESGGPHSNSEARELTEEEFTLFQSKLWELLAKQTRLFTSGESGSIPELTAHRLLSSVCFTLDIDPEDLDPRRVRELLERGLEESYETCMTSLREKTGSIPQLWEQVCLSTPLLESRALKDTLESLRGFWGSYDYRYFAHEITCDIDYPLCHSVPESTQGVDYVTEYLKRLSTENILMKKFDLAQCRCLLKRIHPDYRVLLINLYEPIAVNALGLALAEREIQGLNIDETARVTIKKRCEGHTKREISEMLRNAAEEVCSALRIRDGSSEGYLLKTALDLYPRIRMALSKDALSGIFISY